jgi:enamine deaminase RidA (YjgF/YER057c/UK114 family)
VDRAWREVFSDNPPARTVIPVSGLGVPRWEGRNQGHRDSAIRLEQQCRAVEKGTRREVIRVTPGEFGCEAEAVLAGDYLWISNQYAYRAPGSQTPGSPDEEVSVIFARLEQLCRKAQGSFGDIAQVRAFVSDKEAAAAFFTALRREFPEAPPSASAVVLPAPLAVPDARIFVDAVAHIPGPA